MEPVLCLERSINPNIAGFRDSDLKICVSLQTFRLSLGVVSVSTQTALAMASYAIQPSDWDYLDSIREISRREKLFDPSFRYAEQCFTVTDFKSTLIPEKLYRPENDKNYLDAVFQLGGREYIHSENCPECGARIITAFNSNHIKAAQILFSQNQTDIRFKSVYSALITHAYRMARQYKRFPYHAVLNLRKNEFDLAVVNDGGLMFVNTFPCPDFNHLLYYFLYATGKLKLDMGKVALYLCGESSERNLLPMLEQQVYAITYLPAPGNIRFPHQMPYDKYLCVL